MLFRSKQNINKFIIERPEKEKEKFTKIDTNFSKWGKYYDRPFKSNLEERKTLVYPIKLPDGKVIETQWITSEAVFKEWLQTSKVFFKKLKNDEYAVYVKYYEHETDGVMAPSIIDDLSSLLVNDIKKSHGKEIIKIIRDVTNQTPTESQLEVIIKMIFSNPSVIEGIYNNDAATELKKIFCIDGTRETKKLFPNPKPVDLIKRLIKLVIKDDDIILDSFAGSGTTGQAVLEINQERKTNLQFILIELDSQICRSVTSQIGRAHV